MKNNRGVTAISAVLTTLILILIVFLIYEIFYVDIFDLKKEKESVISMSDINKNISVNTVEAEENNISNTNLITNPITNSNLERK